MKKKVFDIKRYTADQITDALLCPVNRDMTRREHSCDDEALWKNKGQWLIEHYIAFGGATAWAKHRAEYEYEIDVPDPIEEDYQI